MTMAGATRAPSGSARGWARVRDRIEAKSRAHGLLYPWWIPVLSTVGVIGSALVAAAQRGALTPPQPVALAAVLVAVPWMLEFVLPHWWVPWWLLTAVAGTGAAWLLLDPAGNTLTDVSPGILLVVTAEVTACEGARRGLLTCAVGVTLVAALGDTSSLPFNAGAVLLGFVIGAMLHWQMRALAAEQTAREEERERATLAERQRVAREIHDLVAHSLSITLLHLTGARRALAEDADIPDAIAALTDAERIGRQAMADIRRTVGVLRDESSDLRPLPVASDLDALVDDVRAAGLVVDYHRDGDLGTLPDAAGLGLYRVVQESLANATKHAPGAPVRIQLHITGQWARLEVINPVLVDHVLVGHVPVGAIRPADDGSGLVGMAARADQLGGTLAVGPDTGGLWRVHLAVPLHHGDASPRPARPLLP